ncbi:hypothetical protein OE766_27940 [Pararhizobium sp. YC-54]|uniref:hypothetical protein n=1 Tax=Pararhizobium sp. YC-54 TaxID=2986920 RepID=UPI0021F6AA30|nr:hypothetical protein [Pararhizobium sp. YC-54]MCW0002039.1 hypothetical protein [Pararhizobium sp. YC-54]
MIPVSESAPAACAIRLFAQIFVVDDDEDLLVKGANMSHPPLSQEENCELARSKDDRQKSLAFALGKSGTAGGIPSESALGPKDRAKHQATKPASETGAVKTRYLYDVDNDTKSRLYPGPGVIASITGESLSKAHNAIRQVRYGSRWLDFPRTPPIKRTRDGEVQEALSLLGYDGYWRRLPDRPTLAAYLNARTGVERDHPCVVFLRAYCVAVSGGVFCDIFSRGIVIDIDDAEGRRKKVSHVLVLTKRIAPSTIASREPASKAKKNDANSKRDRLFREAIKAETGATRIRITPNEVFVILPDQGGWYWLGARCSLEEQILEPQRDGRLRGNSAEAAAYRASMGY